MQFAMSGQPMGPVRLLIEFVIRATLMAAGTAVVLRLLRVKTAAARHTAWAGVVALMLLLPVWMTWGPKASLRVLPAATAPAASVAGPVEFSSRFALPDLNTPAAPAARPGWSWLTCLAGIYLLGVSLLLARLAVGTVRAHLMVRRAANRGGRLASDSCAAPVTVGWWKPTVIMPRRWTEWPQAQLDAVLTHEGEHARRRDPLVQWLALLNRALFWFHPLAWWLERRLSALAEEACDAAVLARGHDPFQYSEYLLEIARSVQWTGARVKVMGMAMPGNFLTQRIRRILEERPAQRISRVRMVCVATGCALLSTMFMAGAVDRQQTPAAPVAAVPKLPAPAPVTSIAHPASAARALLAQQVPSTSAAPAPVAAELRYKDRRMLVLYFDLMAMPAADRAHAFAAAQGFIRTRMQSSDLLAIMTANGSVTVKRDFTDDRDQLLQTLDQLIADSGPESSAAPDANRQATGLATAVGMLGSLKGKKALVYFSTVAATSDSAQRQPLIDAAIRANVAFYPVDSQALTIDPLGAGVDRALDAYTIGAGDVLKVWVVQQGVSEQVTVPADGMISVPLIGEVGAAGLTVRQLEAAIAGRFEAAGVVTHPSVTVSVVAVHSPK